MVVTATPDRINLLDARSRDFPFFRTGGAAARFGWLVPARVGARGRRQERHLFFRTPGRRPNGLAEERDEFQAVDAPSGAGISGRDCIIFPFNRPSRRSWSRLGLQSARTDPARESDRLS